VEIGAPASARRSNPFGEYVDRFIEFLLAQVSVGVCRANQLQKFRLRVLVASNFGNDLLRKNIER